MNKMLAFIQQPNFIHEFSWNLKYFHNNIRKLFTHISGQKKSTKLLIMVFMRLTPKKIFFSSLTKTVKSDLLILQRNKTILSEFWIGTFYSDMSWHDCRILFGQLVNLSTNQLIRRIKMTWFNYQCEEHDRQLDL